MTGKNKTGGKKYKKNKSSTFERKLVVKDEKQNYAKVKRMLGNKRFLAQIENERREILCHIRGSIKSGDRINVDDIVLVTQREFEKDNNRYDVIMKYTIDEVKELQRLREIKDGSFEEKHIGYEVFQYNNDEREDEEVFDRSNRFGDKDPFDISSEDEEEVYEDESDIINNKNNNNWIDDI